MLKIAKSNSSHIDKWTLWILLALIVKSIFVIYFVSMIHSYGSDFYGFNYKGSFAKAGGDTPSYFESIDKLISNGEYVDDLRMPGYGWIYFVLRPVFSQAASFNIIVLIQLVFSALSVYVLGLIAFTIYKKKIAFYLTYFLYLISTFVSINDYVLMTESLTASTLIISFFYVMRFLEKRDKKYLLISGFFITWSIFLRPIMFPVLLIFGFIVLIDSIHFKTKFKTVVKYLIILFIPFVFFDGLWVYRNYKKHNRFYPFQKSITYAKNNTREKSIINFVLAFGGNISFYQKNSERIYFTPASIFFYKDGADSLLPVIPEYAYTSKFDKDSLLQMRKMIIELNNLKDKNDYQLLDKIIIEKFDSYTASIKNEKPLLFYFYSRLNAIKKLIFNSEYQLGYLGYHKIRPNKLSYNLFCKFYAMLYYFVIVLGLMGLLSFVINKKIINNSHISLLCLILLYLTLVHPLIFKYFLNRYLVPAYPLYILTLIPILMFILKKISYRKFSY